MNTHRLLTIFIFSILIINGCTIADSTSDQPQSTGAASTSQLTIQSGSITISLEANASPAATITDSLPTPSPTSAFDLFELPPTVRPNQAFDILRDQISEASECSLPCVWGITPGEDSAEILYERLLPLGEAYVTEYDELIDVVSIYIPVPESINPSGVIDAYFLLQENIVSEIFVDYYTLEFPNPEPWDVVMRSFGPPDEIFFYGMAGPGGISPVSYGLVLFYSHAGIQLSFDGEVSQSQDRSIWICPLLQQHDFISVTTWDPNDDSTTERLYEQALQDFLQPIANIDSDMTIEDFHTDIILGENTDRCFEVRPYQN